MTSLASIADWLDPTPALSSADWMRTKRKAFIWSKQEEICNAVEKNRYTAVQSCHGIGKSWLAGNLAAWWIDQHPIGEAFVVTTAPTQPQVEAILWQRISEAHEEAGLSGRITWGQVPAWKVGDRMVAFGRKPADFSDKNKAMQAFQGIHARYVLIILDEAAGVPKWLWDAAKTLVTNDNSRILAIGNPDDPTTEFERMCRPGSGWANIRVSAFDLPAYTGEYVPPYLAEQLTGRDWVDERRGDWGEGSPLWQSKILGLFPDISDDTLIWPRWIREAYERTIETIAIGNLGGDVARHGKAETVAYLNRDGHIRLKYVGSQQDTVATQDAFAGTIVTTGAPMWVDADGIGGGVYDNMRFNGMPVYPFHGGQAAEDPDRFINKRAEEYWRLREDLEFGRVDLDETDEKLAAQLGSIKFAYSSRGKIKIESKEDMEDRGLPSPDRADAVMMSRRRPPVIDDGGSNYNGIQNDLTSDLLVRPM
jgi:hypothetical protein